MTLFEKKFGPDFLKTVPAVPAVYTFWDAAGAIVYVGKAKNLRRRLGQYRRATKKARTIVKDSVRITWEVFASDLEACLAELNCIREHRPRRNVVGAYTFMYPLIGMRSRGSDLHLCYTTTPAGFPDFNLFGAFRSREVTGEAFFSLVRLLEFVGHRTRPAPVQQKAIPAYSYVFEFRRLPSDWFPRWEGFFRHGTTEILEALALKLLENAGARAKATEVQQNLKILKRFRREEILPLARVLTATQHSDYPVEQSRRDLLFVRAGHLKKERLL